MKYVIPMEPEDVASLILTRETLRRWAQLFEDLEWASPGLERQVDVIEGMLERAEHTETPALHSVHAGSTLYSRDDAQPPPTDQQQLSSLLKNWRETYDVDNDEWHGVYPGMCINPDICRGHSHCPRDRSCCE